MQQFFIIKWLWVFVLSILTQIIWAQSYKVTWIKQEDGLSFNKVNDVIQDRYGLMWFSTGHGLNRYNGQRIDVFRSNHLDSLSIQYNSAENFCQDSIHNLWVRMTIGGITRYNQLSRQFEYFVYDQKNKTNVNNMVMQFAPGNQNEYWVITRSHLNLLDIPNRTYHPFTVLTKENEIPLNYFLDQERKPWLLYESGLYGIDHVDYQERTIDLETPILQEKITGAYLGKYKNDLLVATDKGLFYKFSRGDTVLQIIFGEPIDFKKNKPEWIFQNNKGEWFINFSNGELFEINHKHQAVRMYDQQVAVHADWIYANEHSSKLVVIDTFQNIHLFDPETNDYETLTFGNKPRWKCIEISKEGIIWLGSFNQGIAKIEPQYKGLGTTLFTPENNILYNHHSANTFLHWNEAHFFVGSGRGLYLLDENNNLSFYQTSDTRLNKYLNNYIVHLMKDKEGYIWVSKMDGLLRFHPDTEDYQIYNANSQPELFIPSIYCTLQDHEGNIWIGGPGGLCVKPEGLDTLIYFYYKKGSFVPDYPIHLRTIYEDRQNNIWLGTATTGLAKARLDKQNGGYQIQVKRFPWKQGQTVNQILEKDERYLWLGNYSSGLMLFDKEKEDYFSLADPSLSKIPNIQGLVWQKGKLWISAIDGLYTFQAEPSRLRHFTTLEGLHSNQFELHAFHVKENGDLLFGGQKGLTCIDPKQIKEVDDPYEILITDFYLSGISVATKEAIQETEKITLPWDENYLGFEVRKPNYFSGQEHKLLYRLEGLENYWTQLFNENRISYPGLKAGEYTLRIRSFDLTDSNPDKEKKIHIHISQPFWKNTWFHLMAILSLVLAGFLFYRQGLRNKMKELNFLNLIRQKAAADYHDEMGHRLARISLFAEVLEYKLEESKKNVSEYLKLIKENVNSLNNSMRDFLWTLDPREDSAFDLALVLKDFGDEFFDQTEVLFTMNPLEETLKEIHFSMDRKRHIVFIFKEAMTNILKHAQANNSRLSFELRKETLLISLEDDGIGMQDGGKGYGIQNMRKRAQEIKAKLSIQSSTNINTLIQLELNIK